MNRISGGSIAIRLTIAIVILIIVFHQLDQPWRGLLDAGVVVGLSWGIVTIVTSTIKAFTVTPAQATE